MNCLNVRIVIITVTHKVLFQSFVKLLSSILRDNLRKFRVRLTAYTRSWTRVGLIRGLGWVGLGWVGLAILAIDVGRVGLGP